MKILNDRNLFYVISGLVVSGANAYNHDDSDISALVKKIYDLNISDDVKTWFACARTGQIEVNPYWPRGSALTTACFFVDNGKLDIDSFFMFLEKAAFSDPIGIEDFREWISDLPKMLSYMDAVPFIQSIWDEYCRIVDDRMTKWVCTIDEAINTVQEFFGSNATEINFAPNLFAAYSTDFVRVGNRITTIAYEPDVESMLHETLHTVVAQYRNKILAFSEKYGLMNFANRDKMIEFGYMEDNSVASITHVIEECFVRAVSVILADKSEERLRVHAEYGCDSVPFIASQFKSISPTVSEFEIFIETILDIICKQNNQKGNKNI